METQVLDRSSAAAREIAKTPVGKTFVNEAAMEEAHQMGARWVRVIEWAGEGRGVFGILETTNWLLYDFGDDTLAETRLAITVTDIQDLGREPYIDVRTDRRHYVGRWQYRGVCYYLRPEDNPGLDLPAPAGTVPFEKIVALPNAVRISNLQPSKDEVKS